MKQKLIEDTFYVSDINKDGKVFEKVSRISGKTETNKLEIELDVNTDIYPMAKGQYYALVLANSLTADGVEEFDLFRHANTNSAADHPMQGSNLIDQYDYVMHGKIFEDKLQEEKEGQMLSVFISFGGLLMSIKGKHKDLKDLEMDSRPYICLKLIG